MALISLDQAKHHLKMSSNPDPRDIEDLLLKMAQAESIVLDLVNTTDYWRDISPTWTDATVPGAVQTAILLVLAHLERNRGDEFGTSRDSSDDKEFWDAIGRMLGRHRDPVIA